MSDLEKNIADAASQPLKASGGGVSAEQHSLNNLIAADKYLSSKRARKSPFKGMKSAKIVPPGAR
jgi:hypothetical protein